MTELTVREQREVSFYEDHLLAVRASDGKIYAAITQMCEALGLDAQGQRQRMERHAVLSKGVKGVGNLHTPGGTQSAYVLRVDLVPLWLAGVRVKSVREELREKLERFQEKAASVLWEAFQEGRLTEDLDLDLAGDSDAAVAYRMAVAMARLARSQLVLEERVNMLATHMEGKVDQLEERLETVEDLLASPDRFVTADQAMQISQAVKTIALNLSRASGTNQYGAIYGELYRRYGITSYKQLPASKFQDAMDWLNEWHAGMDSDTF